MHVYKLSYMFVCFVPFYFFILKCDTTHRESTRFTHYVAYQSVNTAEPNSLVYAFV